jgi:hypothetical protein
MYLIYLGAQLLAIEYTEEACKAYTNATHILNWL